MANRKRTRPTEATATSPERVALQSVAHTIATASGLNITPTEPLFVHLSMVLPLLNLYPASSARYASAVCLSFVVLSLATYWLVKLRLRQNGVIERLWHDQVLDEKKSRVSVGTVLSLLDHLHIIIVFGGVLLCSVNALYWFEPKKTWLQSLYMALMAFNLQGFDDFPVPESIPSRLICAGLSILSVLFVGFLATVFLKPFLIVFKHK